VAEAGLERRDRERLDVPVRLAGFDFGSLDDQHGGLTSLVVVGVVADGSVGYLE
jgi:hypothetical protein